VRFCCLRKGERNWLSLVICVSPKAKVHGVLIIESVDSICRDSADTQYNYANTSKFLKISKTANL